jgi:hypothetical protein
VKDFMHRSSRRQFLQIVAGGVSAFALRARAARAGQGGSSLPAMDSLTGQHCVVYYSPSVGSDVAQTYVTTFDTAWQFIGDTLNSYRSDPFTVYLPADSDTFQKLLIAAGYSPAGAAVDAVGAANVNNGHGTMWSNWPANGRADLVGVGHEYAEDRFVAIQPGNQGAGWFWDGLADTLGLRMTALLPGASCDFRRMTRYRAGLFAIRDGSYEPLGSIVTVAQWTANGGLSGRRYGEGFLAVQYWLRRFGLGSLVQFVQQPKQQPSDFTAALQQVLGISADQFESDFLAAMQPVLDQPPVAVPITVHVDAKGVTPQSYIYVAVYAGPTQGQLFRTPSDLAPDDYTFTLGADGTVVSADDKTTLTSAPLTYTASNQGTVFIDINHPAYQGKAGADGHEGLQVIDIFGRAGLVHGFFGTNSGNMLEEKTGDGLGPWPDGNWIRADADPASADLLLPGLIGDAS